MTNKFQDVFESYFPIPGAYQGTIVDVEDDEVNERVTLLIDIAEGRFKDFWKIRNQKSDHAPKFFKHYQSYRPKARIYFQNLLAKLEKANPVFSLEAFRQAGSDGTSECLEQLKGLKIPIVLDNVEYQSPNGIRSITKITKVFPEEQ